MSCNVEPDRYKVCELSVCTGHRWYNRTRRDLGTTDTTGRLVNVDVAVRSRWFSLRRKVVLGVRYAHV